MGGWGGACFLTAEIFRHHRAFLPCIFQASGFTASFNAKLILHQQGPGQHLFSGGPKALALPLKMSLQHRQTLNHAGAHPSLSPEGHQPDGRPRALRQR